jgi:sterol desaturase/sphingolipid hydroxylase (fatty acid hydroxylase superfamily)
MHPVEHILFYTNFLIHLVVPSHPLHVMFHGYVQSTHPVFSHSGFENLVIGGQPQARMGVFFHQLHHRYFECNYGTVEMPWDRWFGSYHDGTAKATEDTRARKKQMYT